MDRWIEKQFLRGQFGYNVDEWLNELTREGKLILDVKFFERNEVGDLLVLVRYNEPLGDVRRVQAAKAVSMN